MDRLRPRQREAFSGFTMGEVDKLEKLFTKSGEEALSRDFCRKVALSLTRSAGRAGKPIVKWDEVQSWFQKRKEDRPRIIPSLRPPKNDAVAPEAFPSNKVNKDSHAPKGQEDDLSQLEFEAKSSKDGAWYDVDMFLAHRFLDDDDIEIRVRFIGFGSEEDEWVNLKKSVRPRSIPFENSECQQVKVGDPVLCFQERRDQAIYYDARVLEIQRKVHDIRGCRCLFLIRYDHDNREERVRLIRLCWRPT
ncbi:hypothetical protein MLD38_014662 [Melastoma candidum]|uniref:Uncharacterized protein n=1 Tax=Melastoma candidum TaxID=119954 RepID=A0ACB9RFD2_9MYRT|nr:hypothetical protein MLD38_014662 [Melastoma candidum]